MTEGQQPSNPATSAVVGALQQVRSAVQGIAATLQRYETIQSPGLFRVTPAGSSCPSGQGEQATHTRLRVVSWVVSAGTNGGAFSLVAGENVLATVQFAAEGSIVIPLAVTIDRGILVTTDGVAADLYESFLIVHTE